MKLVQTKIYGPGHGSMWYLSSVLALTTETNEPCQIYTLGNVKLLLTLVKYVPQAWINFKRKSTLGFAIDAVLLDFIGGILSIFQLLIDASREREWSTTFGNPTKWLLGNITIFFDIIFIVQHYILYHKQTPASEHADSSGSEQSPLLQTNNQP